MSIWFLALSVIRNCLRPIEELFYCFKLANRSLVCWGLLNAAYISSEGQNLLLPIYVKVSIHPSVTTLWSWRHIILHNGHPVALKNKSIVREVSAHLQNTLRPAKDKVNSLVPLVLLARQRQISVLTLFLKPKYASAQWSVAQDTQNQKAEEFQDGHEGDGGPAVIGTTVIIFSSKNAANTDPAEAENGRFQFE